jgi:electron transport complex protein RnfG
MNKMLKLFIAVVVFSGASGGLLATLRGATQERIESQQIKFVKGPAIQELLKGASNDPLAARFKIKDGKKELDFFPGVFDGKVKTVAMETFGKGYGGNIGLIVAVNIETDEIVGVAVTTHSETPGLGSRAQTDPSFTNQFKGVSLKEPIKMKSEGGKIDAISGATVTSKGVTGGVMAAAEMYSRLKNTIVEKAKATKA